MSVKAAWGGWARSERRRRAVPPSLISPCPQPRPHVAHDALSARVGSQRQTVHTARRLRWVGHVSAAKDKARPPTKKCQDVSAAGEKHARWNCR